MDKTVKRLALVWLGLVSLLCLTIAASYLLAGPASAAASLGVALAKALLIFWFFMELRDQKGLVRIFATGAAVWLMLLVAFTIMDFSTR